jgi:hypothetical protein
MTIKKKDRMSNKDINEMNETEHKEWLSKVGAISEPGVPTEQNLVRLFTAAVQESNPIAKANALVDLANMSLALADVALGSRSYAAKCLVLTTH